MGGTAGGRLWAAPSPRMGCQSWIQTTVQHTAPPFVAWMTSFARVAPMAMAAQTRTCACQALTSLEAWMALIVLPTAQLNATQSGKWFAKGILMPMFAECPKPASHPWMASILTSALFTAHLMACTNTALDPPTPRQGAKNLDGVCSAGLDLTPPHANVNLTTPWAQAPLPDVDQTTRRHRGWSKVHVIDIRAWV